MASNGMVALVVGGAGFIGSHLVDLLLEEGARVRVLDNLLPQAHPGGRARFLSREAELLVEDVRDQAACTRALEGVTHVFHLAGMVGNGQSMYDLVRYADVNVTGTAALWQAILPQRDHIERVVVSSSMVVYGDGAYRCPLHGARVTTTRPRERLERRAFEPICATCGAEVEPAPTSEDQAQAPTSTYGMTKQAQEVLSLVTGRAFGIPTIALRYLNTFGSRQALSNPYSGVLAIFLSRLKNGRAPAIFEDGKQLRDFVHVTDVARANLLAARAPKGAVGHAFNVATGRSTSILEVARSLAGVASSPIAPEVTGAFREGDIRHCFADVDKARALLAFEAKVSLAEGLRELVAWAEKERPEDRTDEANAELRALGLLRS